MSSIGELTFFLGLQVKQKDDGIFISQDKYVAYILKKFDISSVKTASTPIETNKALLNDEEAEDVDVHLYRSMIRSLMYLIASRPDIMFAVCACARFQVTPKVSHLHAVKRIFRYLKDQPKLGLTEGNADFHQIVEFLNASTISAKLATAGFVNNSRLNLLLPVQVNDVEDLCKSYRDKQIAWRRSQSERGEVVEREIARDAYTKKVLLNLKNLCESFSLESQDYAQAKEIYYLKKESKQLEKRRSTKLGRRAKNVREGVVVL
ncbi:uncharacterized mitochondrial protein-like protein [Tanacetum coccineum]